MMPAVFTIFLGDSKTMYLKVLNDTCCGGGPVDLSNCSEIDVVLLNQDGTFTNRLLSTGQVTITQPPVLGQFSVAISSIISTLLNVGELQPVDVTFTISDSVFTVRFTNAISVFQIS